MNLRKLLVRAYPRRWQEEYGPELAGILADQPLTAALIYDVLAGAARQHLNGDPWKLCAVCLTLWTFALLLATFARLITSAEFILGYFAGQIFVLVAGAWTMARGRSGFWGAAAASAKAALVPVTTCALATSTALLTRWGSSTATIWSKSVFVSNSILVFASVAAVFGIVGILAGIIIRCRLPGRNVSLP